MVGKTPDMLTDEELWAEHEKASERAMRLAYTTLGAVVTDAPKEELNGFLREEAENEKVYKGLRDEFMERMRKRVHPEGFTLKG